MALCDMTLPPSGGRTHHAQQDAILRLLVQNEWIELNFLCRNTFIHSKKNLVSWRQSDKQRVFSGLGKTEEQRRHLGGWRRETQTAVQNKGEVFMPRER